MNTLNERARPLAGFLWSPSKWSGPLGLLSYSSAERVRLISATLIRTPCNPMNFDRTASKLGLLIRSSSSPHRVVLTLECFRFRSLWTPFQASKSKKNIFQNLTATAAASFNAICSCGSLPRKFLGKSAVRFLIKWAINFGFSPSVFFSF